MSSWLESFVKTSNGASIQTLYRRCASHKLAFIAHPLGRLGGSLHDHVVQSLATHLSKRYEYSIVLMNSRGVGESSGSASFSGISEAEDYRSVVQHYTKDLPSQPKPDILLCGYSAGSLSASSCKPLPPPARTRYLLISYPLSVLWALTLFRSSTFAQAFAGIVKSGPTPMLSVRGTVDNFTADGKYAAWEETYVSSSASFVKVEGADHFWSDSECKRKLMEEVDGWLAATQE